MVRADDIPPAELGSIERPTTPPGLSERLMSRRSLMSSSILVTESVVRLGLVALVSFWIARELGPEQFGQLNHASAVVAIFWAAALLGLDTPLTARLALSKQPGVVLGSAIALRLVAGLLGGLAAIATAWAVRGVVDDSVVLTAIIALAIPCSAPFVIDCWFKVRNEALPPSAARLLATIVSCGAKVACLLLGLGVVGLAWTATLETVLVACGLMVAFRHRAKAVLMSRLALSKAEVLELMRLTWPFLLSTFAISAFMKIDVVLLGALSTNEETGLYSLSQKLAEVLYLAPVIVIDVLFPQLVRRSTHGNANTEQTQQLFFDLASAVALCVTLAAVAIVSLGLPLVFGEQYAPTVKIFGIHAWACLGVAMYHARMKWLAAVGLQHLGPWLTVLGLALAVLGHLLLIPSFGAIGAASATVAAFALSGWAASYALPSLRPAARMQTRALWPWARLLREWRSAVTARAQQGAL
jgi:PST family polysaccharide transporter